MNSYAAAIDLGVQGIRSKVRIKRSQRFEKLPRLLSTHELSTYWVFRNATVELNPQDVLIVLADDPIIATSFMRCMCALLPADEGIVRGDSRSMMVTIPKRRSFASLSVRQTIQMLAGLSGFTDQEVEANFDAIARMAGVKGKLNDPIEEYPRAIRLQIVFAIAMLAPVDLLAFDGTASVGEPRFREKCVSRLQTARDRDQALMIATRDVSMISSLGSKAIILDQDGSRNVSIAEAVEYTQESKQRRRGRGRP